jgi:hypothetical protein
MTASASLLARALCGDLTWTSAAGWEVSQLIDAADDHGVSPLVWQSLNSVSGPAQSLRDALAHRVRAAATRDIFIRRDLQAVLEALEDAKVRALVIKGAALAYTLYEQPWLRPRTDTDLLVPYPDVPAATRALECCGYARCDDLSSGTFVSHQIAFERVDRHGVNHVIDLHWKVVNPQVLADSLPFEELWRDALPAPALGPCARVPSPHASGALACIHRLAHHQGDDRLIWLYDLRVLTTALDDLEWKRFCRLACARGVAGLCLDGLRRAREHLGIHVPGTVEDELARAAPGEPSRHYLERVVRKRDVLVSDLTLLTSWRARVRLLREHLFPPPAFILQRYGVSNRLLLPALYAYRLVTGAYRWLRA